MCVCVCVCVFVLTEGVHLKVSCQFTLKKVRKFVLVFTSYCLGNEKCVTVENPIDV